MTAYETITLDKIASEVSDMAHECPALQPGTELDAVIVEQVGSRYGIVDGFHRTGGYVTWAKENDRDLASVEIRVLVADDEELIAKAAEPGHEQADAIAALYEQAK